MWIEIAALVLPNFCRASKEVSVVGDRRSPARESRRWTKRCLASSARRCVFSFGCLRPRVGQEWSRSAPYFGGSSVSRPTSWLGQAPAVYTPLKKARQNHVDRRLSCLAGGVLLTLSSGLPVGSCGVRKKKRGRAGKPDAGGLLFKHLLLSGWGYQVTPGISLGGAPVRT